MTCGQCNATFPANHELATIPDARRVAFDAARNRVWRICGYCQHWNLLGPEASVAALVELVPRFAAGKVSEFDGISIAGIGSGLELFQLTEVAAPGEVAVGRVPRISTRDDAAAKRRRGEIDQQTSLYVGFGWVSVVVICLQIVTGLGILFGDFAGGAVVAVLLATLASWAGYLMVVKRMWRRSDPDTPSFMTPWRQKGKLSRLLSFAVAAYSMNTFLDVFSKVAKHGWQVNQIGPALMLLNILVFVRMLVLGQRSAKTTPEMKRLLGLSLGLMLAMMITVFVDLSSSRFGGYALAFLGGFYTLLGIGMLAVRRRKSVTLRQRDGKLIALKAKQVQKLGYEWSPETEDFTVHGLPDGTTVVGDDAARLVAKVLRWYHTSLPPVPGRTDQAWELIRTVGDARGVLAVLQGYQADQSDRVPILTLPPTYRLALDLVLADSPGNTLQTVGHDASQLRLAAESAAEVAEEAEQLDREL